MTCRWCKKKYKKPILDGKVTSCPHCKGVFPEGIRFDKPIDVPTKGSERWYKERWFRRDQKTWESDIKSRKYVGEGKSIRVNEKGERTG